MRDGSGVKSSIVKNKGEGTGTATPPSLQRRQRRRGAADLGYGSRCTVCSAATSTGVSRRHRRAGLLVSTTSAFSTPTGS